MYSKPSVSCVAGIPAFTDPAADVAGATQRLWPHPTARAASEWGWVVVWVVNDLLSLHNALLLEVGMVMERDESFYNVNPNLLFH